MSWLDVDRIKQIVRSGSEHGLSSLAHDIAADAKRRAPIRKVFRQKVRRFRPLTTEEKTIAVQRAIRYYTEVVPNPRALHMAVAHIMTTARVELPVRGSPNALVRSRRKRLLGYETPTGFRGKYGATKTLRGYRPGPGIWAQMTRHAKSEVVRGKSILKTPMARGRTKVQMGGRLKASIHAEEVRIEGAKTIARVAASVYYAKFVEFPTIRTAAQPFLRPAMMSAKHRAVAVVADAVRERIGR
jgi:hypothetical protein